jgi:hypothetical protein
MPFKSKAQRRKFAELLVKGEITEEAYERWNQETGRAELPERVGAKKRKTTRTRKTGGQAKRAKKVARRRGVTKTKRAAATRKRAKRAKRAKRVP